MDDEMRNYLQSVDWHALASKTIRDDDLEAHVEDEVRTPAHPRKNPRGVFFLAAVSVDQWSKAHDGRFPTAEELTAEPLNFTPEFAAEFVAQGIQDGWILEEEIGGSRRE